eukprot:166775-Amphidinium_carterae.1
MARDERRGWATYASFAFSSGYTPGATDDAPFLEHVVAPVLGDAQHPKVPVLRFLVHEAYGLAAADLKSKIERVGDEAPKQLPMHERSVRVERLRNRMKGLDLEGEFEPSYKLVDAAANMVEMNRLKYLPWNACPMHKGYCVKSTEHQTRQQTYPQTTTSTWRCTGEE